MLDLAFFFDVQVSLILFIFLPSLLKGKRSVRSQKLKFVKFRLGIWSCHITKGHDEKRPLCQKSAN